MELNQYHELFQAADYTGIIQLAEEHAAQEPLTLELAYCAAVAHFFAGHHLAAVKQFADLINSAVDVPELLPESERIFAARCSLQLSQLCEAVLRMDYAELSVEEREGVYQLFRLGAYAGGMFAKSVQEHLLERESQKLSERVWMSSAGGAAKPFVRLDSPLALQIEPTNCCNLRCSMCSRRKMTRDRGYLSEEVLVGLLDTWRNAVRTEPFHHQVHGENVDIVSKGGVKLFFLGEPLIHPDLSLLLKRVREFGAMVGVQTNGLLLHRDEFRSKLLLHTPDAISISLDGHDVDSYERVREGSSWADCCEGIALLIRDLHRVGMRDETKVTVATIIPEDTAENRERVTRFLKPVMPYIDGVRFLILNTLWQPEFMDSSGQLVTHGPRPRGPLPSGLLCEEPLTKLNVLWDGTITPCCNDYDGRLALGHWQEGVDGVWNSGLTRDLHRAVLSGDFSNYAYCQNCLGLSPANN